MKAQIYNFSSWVDETDPVKIKAKYDKLLKESGFGVLNFQEHHFKPFGYSALWLLSESHFAIHTFPEEEQSYIELSSCVKKQFDKFINNNSN